LRIEEIHIFDPWPTAGDLWVKRKDFPQHVRYRWECSITVKTSDSTWVSHPDVVKKHIRGFTSRIVGADFAGQVVQVDLINLKDESPTKIVVRTIMVDPVRGAFFMDTPCEIVVPIEKGKPGFVRYVVPNVLIQNVDFVALEYD
jgi:hypothetical protein